MPSTFTNNGNDISFYQSPTRFPAAAFSTQQQVDYTPPAYNPFQQQQNIRFNLMRTRQQQQQQKQEVRGPTVWGQYPVPIFRNYISSRTEQNNELWRQYFLRLQQINNLQNDYTTKQMYSPDPALTEYQQFVRQPTNYQKLLSPTDPRQIQKYYESKYPGFTQLSESEKQRRVTMGRYLLTPLKNLRSNMGMADLRHMINANKSFDSLYKYFKKKPAVLHDISKTIQQSNFESLDVPPAANLKSYAPRLDDNGNLHLDPSHNAVQNKPAIIIKKEASSKQKSPSTSKQEEFLPRLDDAGNLHLDRAKKIFYTSAHPVEISRERALQIAMQRAHASTNKRINPRVLNKLVQSTSSSSPLNFQSPYQYMLATNQNKLINRQSTGLPLIRQKSKGSLKPMAPDIKTNGFPIFKENFVGSFFTAPAIIRNKPEHIVDPQKLAPMTKNNMPVLPIIRLLLPTKETTNKAINKNNNENYETKSLYESLNSLFSKPSSRIIPEIQNTGIPMLRTKPSTVLASQPKLNNKLTGVPMIRAKAKVKEDEPPSDYPKPLIRQTSGGRDMGVGWLNTGKSKLAIATEPPLHNIEPVHGNTALKINTLRKQSISSINDQENLLSFLQHQTHSDKYTQLLQNALSEVKSNINNEQQMHASKFRIFDKTKADKTPPTFIMAGQGVVQPLKSEKERKNTAKQLSLVEDFLKTKFSDVNDRPTFKKPSIESHQTQMVDFAQNEQQPGVAELSNFFKEKEMESHEIEKVDKPIFKTRRKIPSASHLHTEFLLKTISPDPLPWDKRAKVTFKLSKKSDIPGKPQRVVGMYGSLKKKKKKRKKKKRMSEEDVEFALPLTKRNTLKVHNSKIKKSKNSKKHTRQSKNKTRKMNYNNKIKNSKFKIGL